jgi:hypothetical protein
MMIPHFLITLKTTNFKQYKYSHGLSKPFTR